MSRSKKILFVHIQKTGGSSVKRVLEKYCPDLEDVFGSHDSARIARNELGEDQYNQFTKFAFVRNPWDRLVSWYSMIDEKRGDFSPYKKIVRKLKGKKDRSKFWDYVIRNSSCFREFVEKCTDSIDDFDGVKSIIFNQLDYLTDEDGNIIVDYIGKYEDLGHDFDAIMKKIGVSDASLPHINRSSHTHYSHYYTEKLRDLVAERHKRDITHFGYSFESRA